eukprot:scpid62048/ scgid4369/ SEC14-like protein 3; 45 kDa secretory protein
MSGHFGDLSPKQSAALLKLRECVADVKDQFEEDDDYYYLRWLRARNFDVEKTEKQLRDHIVAMDTWKFSTVLDWEAPLVIQKYLTGRLHGYTREGQPVFWERVGRLDLRGVVRAATRDDTVRYRVRQGLEMMQGMKAQTEKLGRRIDTCVVIYDMEGLSIQKHFAPKGIQYVVEMVKVFEANFPEILEAVYIVNVPSIFDLAYNIVKPFLNEVTRKKVTPIPGAPEVCYERLRELIEPSILPACYGGSFVPEDGDISCDSLLVGSALVPRSMYLKASKVPVSEESQTVTVSRRSTSQVEIEVTTAGAKLWWGFASEGNDIAFSVLHKPSERAGVKQHAGQMEEIVPSRRVDSHVNFEEGSVVCNKAGIYVVRFDNTYSWTKAKVVHYLVRVEEPVDKEPVSPTASQDAVTATASREAASAAATVADV